MPHDLSHLGFLACQLGRLMTISTTPVISGDSFFFSSTRRHTRLLSDWSSDVCSSDLEAGLRGARVPLDAQPAPHRRERSRNLVLRPGPEGAPVIPRSAGLLVIALLGVSASPAPAPDPPFGSYWHDGKAELDGYRYTVTRYGQLRRGQCTAIYVTEPFSRSKRVKVDDAARNPNDTFDVLKLNLVRDFQTGIYDYNTMTSLFVRSDDLEPVKASFASMEWCGHVYEELRVDPGLVSQRLSSYFENESTSQDA